MRDPESRTEQELMLEVASLRQKITETEQARERAITIQVKTLRKLATKIARRRTLLRTIPDVVWLNDVNSALLFCNAAAERLLGAKEADLVGKTPYEYMDKEPADLLVETDRRTIAADGPSIDEAWLTFAEDGHRALCESIKTPFRDAGGNVIGVLCVARDITAHYQVLEKLKETLAELGRSNEELEQFAYVASHDLQEPLRMVSSYTQLLARRYRGRLDADADEFIGYAVDGANRMQRLINDLLIYSRAGTRGRKLEPVDCTEALAQSLANLQTAVRESGAVVTHGPLPSVMADPTQIAQLLQNLLGNAIKFHGEEPPRIHVAAERKGSQWLFSVRDNGIGIDPRNAQRIFAIFHRLHTREEYPGTGIGLAICKKIVERHGGRIWVESQLGAGSTFHFTIAGGGHRS